MFIRKLDSLQNPVLFFNVVWRGCVELQSVDSAVASWDRDVTVVASSNENNNDNTSNNNRDAVGKIADVDVTETSVTPAAFNAHSTAICRAENTRITGALTCQE